MSILPTSNTPTLQPVVSPQLASLLSHDDLNIVQKEAEDLVQKLETCRNSGQIDNLHRQIEAAVDGLAQSKKQKNLQIVVKYNLIKPEKLGSFCKTPEILEFFIPLLVEALNGNGSEKMIYLLKDAKIFQPALKIFPRSFEVKMVQKALRDKWVSPEGKKSLFSEQKLQGLFHGVLENALADNDTLTIELFRETSILKNYSAKANDEQAIKLVRYELVGIDFIKEKLNNSNTTIEFSKALKEELKTACTKGVQVETLIETLVKSGVEYDSEDVYRVAKTGKYSLLALFESKGGVISDTVFSLIENGPDSALIELLEEDRNRKRLDPNLANQDGDTLLIQAVNHNKVSIVKGLLAWGANPLIRDHRNRTVFELCRQKSSYISQLLYNPSSVQHRLSSGNGWNNDLMPEESVLEQLLKRKAAGSAIGKYSGLFIRIQTAVVAILKSSPFSNKMKQSWNESMANHPTNRIQCWVSSLQYPIPPEFAPKHTNMYTIGFAIIKANQQTSEENVVKIDNKRYTWIPLTNSYIAEDSSLEYGFKYSYEGIQTHGHGKNPEAVRSAFRESREEMGRLGKWVSGPDLNAEQENLVKSSNEFTPLFQQEKENAGKLEELINKVNAFMQQTEAIIETRYSLDSSEDKKRDENQLIEKEHSLIEKELGHIYSYTFNTNRLDAWQVVIQKQISALINLEKKLQASKCMEIAIFDKERESVETHLRKIKNLITHQTVTSSEIPTFKIYSFPLLVEDIFSSSPESIHLIKTAICQTIGANLHSIPVPVVRTF